MEFNEILDVSGRGCPYATLKTKLKIEKMQSGEILKVITDHEPAIETIPHYVQKQNHEYLGIEDEKIDDHQIWSLYFKINPILN